MQYSTVSIVMQGHGAILYRTIQCRTVQYSTAQYCTALCIAILYLPRVLGLLPTTVPLCAEGHRVQYCVALYCTVAASCHVTVCQEQLKDEFTPPPKKKRMQSIQRSTLEYSIVMYCTALQSRALCNTVPYSTSQHCRVQYNTIKCLTVQVLFGSACNTASPLATGIPAKHSSWTRRPPRPQARSGGSALRKSWLTSRNTKSWSKAGARLPRRIVPPAPC